MLYDIGVFTVTKDMVDRDGERVLPMGGNYNNFKKNPIMFYNHSRWDSPIGKWSDIEVKEDSVEMRGWISDTTNISKNVLGLIKDDVIRTASIGFKPLVWSEDEKDKLPGQKGVTIKEYEILEVSVCDIPANPESVMKTMDNGVEKTTKVYNSFKSWERDKDGIIVKDFQFQTSKNFDMNILEVVNKFLGTSFGDDAKTEDVEAAFKKLSESKGVSVETVQKSLQEYDVLFKQHVTETMDSAIGSLKSEVEALKVQIKEMKEEDFSPEGEDDNLSDREVEKSAGVIDVRQFFANHKSN